MAWAKAFYALAQSLEPGDRILTGVVEYGANYVAMLQVTNLGFGSFYRPFFPVCPLPSYWHRTSSFYSADTRGGNM